MVNIGTFIYIYILTMVFFSNLSDRCGFCAQRLSPGATIAACAEGARDGTGPSWAFALKLFDEAQLEGWVLVSK